jgi:hypothetical protein
MLVPGNPGKLGTPIYVFTVESPQPVRARHTSCMQLLWKPNDLPGKTHAFTYYIWNLPTRGVKEHFMYAVTVETLRPEQGRRTHLLSYHWNVMIHGARQVHVRSYCRSPTIWAGRHTHLLSHLWKLATRVGKEHFMYTVTAETPRSGQARHMHFCISCGNLAIWAGKAHSFT